MYRHSLSCAVMVALASLPGNGGPSRHPARSGDSRIGAADTVDVAVGSPLIDMTSFIDHGTRVVGTRLSGDSSVHAMEMTTRLTLGDSAGIAGGVLRIHSEADALAGLQPPGHRTEDVTLDRKTLAPYAVHRASEGNGPHATLAFNGTQVRGVRAMGGPEQPVSVDLTERAFYGPGVDYVLERLPLRAGVVYRIPIFNPGPGTAERRLYPVVGTEAVDVMGSHHAKAWRVDELAADGRRLGTLWIVKGEPSYLVRWDIAMQPSGTFRLEQQLTRGAH